MSPPALTRVKSEISARPGSPIRSALHEAVSPRPEAAWRMRAPTNPGAAARSPSRASTSRTKATRRRARAGEIDEDMAERDSTRSLPGPEATGF